MDVLEKDVKEDSVNNSVDGNDKPVYKTKEYILRAHRNYRQRKRENDETYNAKVNEYNRKYRESKKDEYNEKHRLYMREYRAKKKAVASATTTNATPEQPDLIVKQAECNGAESIEAATATLGALTLSRE
jgi:hypothetical protein